MNKYPPDPRSSISVSHMLLPIGHPIVGQTTVVVQCEKGKLKSGIKRSKTP